MKKFLFPALTAILMLASCSDDNGQISSTGQESPFLSIQTEISTMNAGLRSAGPLSSFPEGSQLSLWVTPGTLGTNYDVGPYNNVLAEYVSGKWELTPAVKLSGTPATIYAFYPYYSGFTNGKDNMNIYHNNNNQVDNMYGTNARGQEAINRDNPSVRLEMKHAKALLRFRIKKMNYKGEGRLTRIEVANSPSRTDLRSAAAVNISTGEITHLGTNYHPAVVENDEGIITITEETPATDAGCAHVMVVPVAKTTGYGSIQVTFTIDDVPYIYNVPADTAWEQATKYTYDMILNGTELRIGEVIITDWLEGPINSGELF